MTMTKTAAIKAARQAVSAPIGAGTSWQVYHPYYNTFDGLKGASTCNNASSYSGAVAMRARIVAGLAICLMDLNSDDAQYAIYNETWDRTIPGLVNAAIAASAQ